MAVVYTYCRKGPYDEYNIHAHPERNNIPPRFNLRNR